MLRCTYGIRRAANMPKEPAGAEAIDIAFIFVVKRWSSGLVYSIWNIICCIPISHNNRTSSAYDVHFVGVTGISPSFAHASWAIAINQLNIEGVPTSSGTCPTTLCICCGRVGILVIELSCCISSVDNTISAPSSHTCSIHGTIDYPGFCRVCSANPLKSSGVYST
jgi:hypothetical protein